MKTSQLLSCCLLLVLLDWTVCCPIVTNGCSTPNGIPFFYKRTFTPACNKHDVCYFCGQRYGWSRSLCDTRFKRDMESTCPDSWWRRKACKKAAKAYYLATRKFGGPHYNTKSPDWCKYSCAKRFGNPN